MDYKSTSLWQKAFRHQNDGNDSLRDKLAATYEHSHENAKILLAKISKDFPNLTVHDISHIDGLWQVASTITGKDYDINPLEGFVLGCAFLMHDAVQSYEAFGGVDALRGTPQWKDYLKAVQQENVMTQEEEQQKEADFRTIRLLHAKAIKDKELHRQQFKKDDGATFYIIEDPSDPENQTLRDHLGELICDIAASHHLNIDKVEALGNQSNALAEYEWSINPIKLACILRCADAGHIDASRAPDHLLKLLSINGVSRDHWNAQNRLSQLKVDDNDSTKVLITSTMAFPEEEFAAWNVAYDAVHVLDHELKSSNELLKRKNIPQFQAQGVSGAESREALSNHIKTKGWSPCDATLHVSNVDDIIRRLGGEQLYGSKNKIEIALRELIQNARDAIAARRKQEEGFKGAINVKIEQEGEDTYIEVTDNGLGMSPRTIKDYLLNFGSSYWASDLAKEEYPGLYSSGFESVGRFGIGFYSIFMVAAEVEVNTRPYRNGLDDNKTIRFPNGLSLRPIIKENPSTTTNISTSVRIKIDNNKAQWEPNYIHHPNWHEVELAVPYSAFIARMTAGLDVDVYYTQTGNAPKRVHQNLEDKDFDGLQWLLDITYANYLKDPNLAEYIKNNHIRLRDIKDDNGKIYGKGLIKTNYYDDDHYNHVYTVGGLSDLYRHDFGPYYFIGCLFSEPHSAARYAKDIDHTTLKKWAKDQYDLFKEQGLTDDEKLMLPYAFYYYGIDTSDALHIDYYHKGTRYQCDLPTLINRMKNHGCQLVFPCTTITEKKNPNFNFFIYDNLSSLFDSPSDVNDDYTILRCIKIQAEKLGYSVQTTFKEKMFKDILGRPVNATIVEII
ncbi:MAG: ATP-binding protein [Bacteroidales bacterium]|nr:ATP-binding protein [Bacteroidales bacterium]